MTDRQTVRACKIKHFIYIAIWLPPPSVSLEDWARTCYRGGGVGILNKDKKWVVIFAIDFPVMVYAYTVKHCSLV